MAAPVNNAADFIQTGKITAAMLAASASFTSTVTATKTSAYNAVIGDCVQCDPTGGTFNVTLPAVAAGNKGQAIIIKNVGTSATSIGVARSGADTIDGGTSDSIIESHGSRTYVSDGTSNWLTTSGNDAKIIAALALTTASNGASLVGIQDSASLITATTVETALAELVKYVPVTLADPGTGAAIPVTRSATVNMTCNGSETNSLAIPTFAGQVLILNLDTATSGSRVVTCAQNINQATNKVMTFAQARDFIELHAITVGGALRWQVAANDGVALS